MKKCFDVIALGELLIDYTEYGVSPQGNPLWEANPGGAPCNVLAMLRKLGKRTSFIGKVGRDVYGRQLEGALIETGIDTSGLLFDDETHTTLAIVGKKPDGDRDFVFFRDPGADMALREDEVPLDLIGCARCFHFGTLSMTHEGVRAATKKAALFAKEKGLLLSFDPNLRPPLWKSEENMREQTAWGLGACDILKISDDELFFFTGETDIEKGIGALRARFPNIVLISVTAGAKGSVTSYRDLLVFVPAFLLRNTVETTGAGDTYCACALSYILDHGLDALTREDLTRMATFASAAAALITSRKGALRVMPEKAEVEALILERRARGAQN